MAQFSLPARALLAGLLMEMGIAGVSAAQDFAHALVRRGCTQEDARAIEIVLTPALFAGPGDPAPPYLRFEVALGDWAALSGRDLALAPLSRLGFDPSAPLVRGEAHPAQGPSVWLGGILRLEHIEMGGAASGSFDATAPDGKHYRGAFNANWVNTGAGCG